VPEISVVAHPEAAAADVDEGAQSRQRLSQINRQGASRALYCIPVKFAKTQ
jgi:hypothetical protein